MKRIVTGTLDPDSRTERISMGLQDETMTTWSDEMKVTLGVSALASPLDNNERHIVHLRGSTGMSLDSSNDLVHNLGG